MAQLRRDVTALTSCLTTVWERSGRGEAVCSATLARLGLFLIFIGLYSPFLVLYSLFLVFIVLKF